MSYTAVHLADMLDCFLYGAKGNPRCLTGKGLKRYFARPPSSKFEVKVTNMLRWVAELLQAPRHAQQEGIGISPRPVYPSPGSTCHTIRHMQHCSPVYSMVHQVCCWPFSCYVAGAKRCPLIVTFAAQMVIGSEGGSSTPHSMQKGYARCPLREMRMRLKAGKGFVVRRPGQGPDKDGGSNHGVSTCWSAITFWVSSRLTHTFSTSEVWAFDLPLIQPI